MTNASCTTRHDSWFPLCKLEKIFQTMLLILQNANKYTTSGHVHHNHYILFLPLSRQEIWPPFTIKCLKLKRPILSVLISLNFMHAYCTLTTYMAIICNTIQSAYPTAASSFSLFSKEKNLCFYFEGIAIYPRSRFRFLWVFDAEKTEAKREGRGTRGGGLAAFDYQQQGCLNVFMSVTHKWSSTVDKIWLRKPHIGRF